MTENRKITARLVDKEAARINDSFILDLEFLSRVNGVTTHIFMKNVKVFHEIFEREIYTLEIEKVRSTDKKDKRILLVVEGAIYDDVKLIGNT